MAGRRPGRLFARRDRPDPAQHQGRQALADTAVEEAGPGDDAYDHRQARLLWSSAASGHAGRRAPVAQGLEQQSGEFACATAKTRADDARLSITGEPPAFRLDLLCSPQSLRPAPFKMLRLSDPSSPPECHGAMESCCRRDRLKSFPKVTTTAHLCLCDITRFPNMRLQSNSNRKGEQPCHSVSQTSPPTSPPRPPKAPSASTNGWARAGASCSPTPRTTRRCARPNLATWRASSPSS